VLVWAFSAILGVWQTYLTATVGNTVMGELRIRPSAHGEVVQARAAPRRPPPAPYPPPLVAAPGATARRRPGSCAAGPGPSFVHPIPPDEQC
ncbi:hypothetical protein, partial [Rathayibacter sp. AY1C9]|uniref:hypothetical protein n=1 Tax=Rathayibacter sp. AY1C9 TaxID=2080541 RepID=UPI001CA4D133